MVVQSQFIEETQRWENEGTIRDLIHNTVEKAGKKFSADSKIRYIDISSVDNGTNTVTGVTEYIFKDAPSRAQQCVRKGDILVSTVRPNLKNIAVNHLDGDDLVASSGFCVLRPKEGCAGLIMAYILSDVFTEKMTLVAKGTNYPAIHDSDILNYKIRLSDDSKVSMIDRLFKQADKSKFDGLKSQFISQFGFPQDGAEKYPSATIESLLQETISGEWGTDCSDDSGTKVIRTTNFTNEGVLDLTDVVVRTIDAKKVEKKQLKKGDIILEKSGGTKDNPVGRLVYFEEEGVFVANNFTQVLRPAEDINSRYLFAALYYLYQTHKPLIKGLGNQTNGIQNLKVPQYLQLQISVPDRTAQDDFERICRQADKSKFELKQAIEKIDNVMRALMQ